MGLPSPGVLLAGSEGHYQTPFLTLYVRRLLCLVPVKGLAREVESGGGLGSGPFKMSHIQDIVLSFPAGARAKAGSARWTSCRCKEAGGVPGEGLRQEKMEKEQNQGTQKAVAMALQGLGHVVQVARG